MYYIETFTCPNCAEIMIAESYRTQFDSHEVYTHVCPECGMTEVR